MIDFLVHLYTDSYVHTFAPVEVLGCGCNVMARLSHGGHCTSVVALDEYRFAKNSKQSFE